jgi:drug/metabolite transporter (DMT)-like permease
VSGAPQPSRARGYLLGASGVLILSSDALLIRLVDAPVLVVMSWRGALMCAAFLCLEALRGGPRMRRVARPDPAALLAALLYAGSGFAFVTAIVRLPVAQALVLVATVPLSSAVLGRLFAGDPLTPLTLLTGLACTGGIVLALTPAGLPTDPVGIAAGLAVSVTFGAYLTVLRSGRVQRPNLVLADSSLLAACIAAPLAGDLRLEGVSLLAALALGLLVMPLSQALLSSAPRHITAGEVGMLLTLETVFGSLLAWWLLGETIDGRAVLGGSIVVSALALRAGLAVRGTRARA